MSGSKTIHSSIALRNLSERRIVTRLSLPKGAEPSRDIKILNNVIEDLQLEVDHSQDVVIEGNTVSRAVNTAGIGIFTVGHNAIAEDYLIKGNTVIDPPGAGFSVGIDPPSSRNCVFRRITIINNQGDQNQKLEVMASGSEPLTIASRQRAMFLKISL